MTGLAVSGLIPGDHPMLPIVGELFRCTIDDTLSALASRANQDVTGSALWLG